jgi:hypothetical protein
MPFAVVRQINEGKNQRSRNLSHSYQVTHKTQSYCLQPDAFGRPTAGRSAIAATKQYRMGYGSNLPLPLPETQYY